jgi:hypothetical protein
MGDEYISVSPSNISSGQACGYSSGTPILQFKIGSFFSFFCVMESVVFLSHRGWQVKPEMEQPRKWVLSVRS